MSTMIFIPKMGMSATSGTITEWLVEDGGRVEKGQPLYVISTDKVDSEVESPAAGFLSIEAPLDEELPVGTPIAEITDEPN